MNLRKKIKNKFLKIAEKAERENLKEQIEKDIILYKSVMPIEMEQNLFKLFIKGPITHTY